MSKSKENPLRVVSTKKIRREIAKKEIENNQIKTNSLLKPFLKPYVKTFDDYTEKDIKLLERRKKREEENRLGSKRR